MDAHHLALSARLGQIAENVAERAQIEAAGRVVLRPLPTRRPQMLVQCTYAEPDRGYALTLFCGCGIEPRSLDVVEVFVRPGHGGDAHQPQHRDAMMERQLDDAGRLISFLLRLGFSPAGLRDQLGSTAGAGVVTIFDQAIAVDSPIGAIVEACVWAQAEIAKARAAAVPS